MVTDASQNAVRVRRRDKDTALDLTKRAAKVCWQLRKEAPAMKTVWQEAMPKLTSRENWARLYGIETEFWDPPDEGVGPALALCCSGE